MIIDYTNFQQALQNLINEYDKYQNRDGYPKELEASLSNSVFLSFILCWDAMIKATRKHLQKDQIPNIPVGGKQYLRYLNQTHLINTDIQNWFTYLEIRNSTAHEYNLVLLATSLSSIKNYIDDAIVIYQTISKKTWQQ